MSRMSRIEPGAAAGEAAALLEKTRAQLGRVPNLYATLAQAPAALTGYLDLRAALTRGALPPALRELLALLVAETNHCDYCVAAHTFRGGKMGLAAEDLAAARRAEARDPKTAAALRFARVVSETRGRVTDADLADARAAGWRDDELLEVVAHVALNAFSNYVSHVAQPELDFPPAP